MILQGFPTQQKAWGNVCVKQRQGKNEDSNISAVQLCDFIFSLNESKPSLCENG